MLPHVWPQALVSIGWLNTRAAQIPGTSEGCASWSAAHDLAALSEGHLSEGGMRRLADHVCQCRACRVVLASLIGDLQEVESTGNHRATWLEGASECAHGEHRTHDLTST